MRGDRPTHVPERDATLFVQGEMKDRHRRVFEAHLLGCERCWDEVQGARRGRALAERGRELSPPELRESVRAAVALSGVPADRRRRILVPTAAVLLLVLAATTVLVIGKWTERAPEQPAPIAAALASFRSERPLSGAPTKHSAPDLRSVGLSLLASGRYLLGGIPVDAFRFADGRTRVMVFLSGRSFPEAAGATERAGAVHGWDASVDGVRLACADTPVSYLLMSTDPLLLSRAEAALRAELVIPTA